MPITFYPEGDDPRAQDPFQRSLVKINSKLYDALGSMATIGFFPEDTQPYAQDPPPRSLKKINALLGSLSAAIAAVGTKVFADVAEVRAETTRYMVVIIQPDGWGFSWDATSTADDDGVAILKPDDIDAADPGRYERFL